MKLLSMDDVSVYAEGFDHPEGIACGLDGAIYTGGEAGQLYKVDPATREAKILAGTGGVLLGITLDGNGNVYVCDAGNRVIQKVMPSGKVEVFCKGSQDENFIFPNFMVFDYSGNMYVSDSGDFKKDNGKIFRISPEGHCRVWCRELNTFPNGLCLDHDENYLYVAMSFNPPRICRVEIQQDGNAGRIEEVIHMPKTVPDGLAFDVDGNLFIACYRPDAIFCYTRKKALKLIAEDYEGEIISAPTNIAFCGENHKTLIGANLGVHHLTEYHLNVTGMKLNYPYIDKGAGN